MNEEFLIYLWKNQLIDKNLLSVGGESITIIHPGEININSGPDFFNARIKIGDTVWAGNIEIHIHSSDWFAHQHQSDPAYDNIILHVVHQNDLIISRKNGEKIPEIELKNKYNENILKTYRSFIESKNWIPCQDLIEAVPYFHLISFFDKLMIERLESKAKLIHDELNRTHQDFQEVFYRKLLQNFGFKVNDAGFELLSKSLTLKILGKHSNHLNQLEALLFGQAGMLSENFKDQYPNSLKSEYQFLTGKYDLKPINPKLWKFMRLRPANFPTIRIAQFAQLIKKTSGQLTKILEAEKLSDVINLFNINTSRYWETHYRFDKFVETRNKKIGKTSIDLLLINTLIPFIFVYGQHKNDTKMQDRALLWLDQIKSENNNIIRKFKEIGIRPQNALQSQALLELKTNYCNKIRCLECRVGHFLLKTKQI